MFTEEQRNELRHLAEKKRQRGRGDEGRSKQRYGQKQPSGAQLSKKFKIVGQALGDLESALNLAGHSSQARDIEHVAGMVRGVESRL